MTSTTMMGSANKKVRASLDNQYSKSAIFVPNIIRRTAYYTHPLASVVCQAVHWQFRSLVWQELQQRLAAPKHGMLVLQSPALIVNEDYLQTAKSFDDEGSKRKLFDEFISLTTANMSERRLPHAGRNLVALNEFTPNDALVVRMENLLLNAVLAHANSYGNMSILMFDFHVADDDWCGSEIIDDRLWTKAISLVYSESGQTLKHFVVNEYHADKRRKYIDVLQLDCMLASMQNLETLYFPARSLAMARAPTKRHSTSKFDWSALQALPEEKRLPKLRRVVVDSYWMLKNCELPKFKLNEKVVVESAEFMDTKTVDMIFSGTNLAALKKRRESVIRIVDLHLAEEFSSKDAYFDKIMPIIRENWKQDDKKSTMTVWNDLHAVQYGMPAKITKKLRFHVQYDKPENNVSRNVDALIDYVAKNSYAGIIFSLSAEAYAGKTGANSWLKLRLPNFFLNSVLPYLAVGEKYNASLQLNSCLRLKVSRSMSLEKFIRSCATCETTVTKPKMNTTKQQKFILPKIDVVWELCIDIDAADFYEVPKANLFAKFNKDAFIQQHIVKAVNALLCGVAAARGDKTTSNAVYHLPINEHLERLKFKVSSDFTVPTGKDFPRQEQAYVESIMLPAFEAELAKWSAGMRERVIGSVFGYYVIGSDDAKTRSLSRLKKFDISFESTFYY